LRAIGAIGSDRRKHAGRQATGEAFVILGIGEAVGFQRLDDAALASASKLARWRM